MRSIVHMLTVLILLSSLPGYAASASMLCGPSQMGEAHVVADDMGHEEHSSEAPVDHRCGVADGCKAPAHCSPILLTAAVQVAIARPEGASMQPTPALIQPILPTEVKPPRA